MDLEYWRGRKVLVTGHTGFKGGWLCLWLERLGAQLTGVALPPGTDPSLFELLSPWQICVISLLMCVTMIARLRPSSAATRNTPSAAQPIVSKAQADAARLRNERWASFMCWKVPSVTRHSHRLVITTDKVYANAGGRAFRRGLAERR
jgi:CDP-glucose 4,6-dehydratase